MEKRICAKNNCENNVPKYHITEDGKKHNLQKRKFCLECSPYGQHNTRNFNNKHTGICKKCGKTSQNNRSKCYTCFFNERQLRVSKKIYDLVGYGCWKCGYDEGIKAQSILDFHHINPEDKLFGLSTREFVGHTWDKVWLEMQKCVSICCRCHREYHAGIITDEEIKKIYKKRWKKIGL